MFSGGESPIVVGVTELVQFCARSGDLFHEDLSGPSAQDGLRGHQQLQKSRQPPWLAEQAVSHQFDCRGVTLKLSGRVDLINPDADPIIIEEIKTCHGAGHLLPVERKNLHWAQLKVYAALLLFGAEAEAQSVGSESGNFEEKRQQQSQLLLRVTYYDLLSRQIVQEEELVSAEDVKVYCRQLVEMYIGWWQRVNTRKLRSRQFAKALNFPYEKYRPGQRELAVSVFRHLRDGRPLVVEAPTGTGKTLSVLFPAIKAFGEEHLGQMLYLTPKGSAQHNVLKALQQLGDNAALDVLVIQARDKSCPCLSAKQESRNGCATERGMCARTIGFFDRLPAAREAALERGLLTADAVQQLAEEFQLCPFALSIQLVPWFSLVVADINYYFDPLVRLACFEQSPKSRVLLLDELHNLPARARDMYSAELDSELCAEVHSSLPRAFVSVRKPLGKLVSFLRQLQLEQLQPGQLLSEQPQPEQPQQDQPRQNSQQQLPQALMFLLQELLTALQQTGDNGFAGGMQEGVTSAYRAWVKSLYRFVTIAGLRGPAHTLLLEKGAAVKTGGETTLLKVVCLDAAEFLAQLMTSAHSVIGFSATLQPFEFSLLQNGLSPSTTSLQLDSWFPVQNQLTLCCRYVNTSWQQRQNSLEDLVALIHEFTEARRGRYLIFFPSYAYLEMTRERFLQRFPETNLLVQSAEASDQEREIFLRSFTELSAPAGDCVGFAIVGGVFAEGVDYAGDALHGAMIIGTGMPQPDELQQRIAHYYRDQGKDAYRHAYQYPGFIRLKQTAGRVIRSERDRGVVVFVEPRLDRPDYRRLMPHHWQVQCCDSLNDIIQKLQAFWSSKSDHSDESQQVSLPE